jgi:hypothetical protein
MEANSLNKSAQVVPPGTYWYALYFRKYVHGLCIYLSFLKKENRLKMEETMNVLKVTCNGKIQQIRNTKSIK